MRCWPSPSLAGPPLPKLREVRRGPLRAVRSLVIGRATKMSSSKYPQSLQDRETRCRVPSMP